MDSILPMYIRWLEACLGYDWCGITNLLNQIKLILRQVKVRGGHCVAWVLHIILNDFEWFWYSQNEWYPLTFRYTRNSSATGYDDNDSVCIGSIHGVDAGVWQWWWPWPGSSRSSSTSNRIVAIIVMVHESKLIAMVCDIYRCHADVYIKSKFRGILLSSR